MLAGAEVVDVEQERRFAAVADAHLQVGADRFVDVFDLFERGELLFEAPRDAVAVVRSHQQQGVSPLSVAARAARLLVVAFERVAHGVVDHEPHVGFVDAHAESVRGDHHADLAREPLLLPQRPFGVPQSAVVGRGRDAFLPQEFGGLLGALAGAHVDDARAGNVVHQPQQLAVLVVGAADAVRKVGASETAAQDVRLGEFEVAHDVLGHQFRGRGGERQHGDSGELFAQFGDAQVRGAEVVAPLRDAVGFVNGQKRDVHPHDAQAERLGGQSFRRDVEEFHVAVDAVVQCDVDGPGREARMDRHGRDAPCPEAIDLVFHQGDERRDDDAHAFAGEGRNLIGERLSAARGHQRQRVAPFHDGADDPLLHGTELREAPVAFQRVVYLVRSRFHNTKIVKSGTGAKKRNVLSGRSAVKICRAVYPFDG